MLGGLLVGYGTRHFVSAFYFVNRLPPSRGAQSSAHREQLRSGVADGVAEASPGLNRS